MVQVSIERPADVLEGDWWERHQKACQEESPAWGLEGEGEQCQRPPGHDGPHYLEETRFGSNIRLQWESHQ